MRNVDKFTILPSAIMEFTVEPDRVHVRLKSGHYISWPNKGGLTVVGEKVLTGIQAHATDCFSVDGVTLKDNNGAAFTGLAECQVCHGYSKVGTICPCQEKADETRKTLEGVK